MLYRSLRTTTATYKYRSILFLSQKYGFPSKYHLSTAGLPNHALFSKFHQQRPVPNNSGGYLMTHANNGQFHFLVVTAALRDL
jgi:hypothetical protein